MTAPVAVVTGGSRGIGRAIVLEATRRGYDVVFSHRGRGTDAGDTQAQASGSDRVVTGVAADMTIPVDLTALAEVAREVGPVELLITCAGVLRHAELRDITEEVWREAFAVHVTAPMRLARELAPDLAKASGAILNVASDGGVVGSVHGAPYGASKSGTIGLSHTLARELAPSVRVNTLAPGPVDTDMWSAVGEDDRRKVEDATPLGRVGTTAEIARAALDMCSWTYVTGQTLVVNGGRVMQ